MLHQSPLTNLLWTFAQTKESRIVLRGFDLSSVGRSDSDKTALTVRACLNEKATCNLLHSLFFPVFSCLPSSWGQRKGSSLFQFETPAMFSWYNVCMRLPVRNSLCTLVCVLKGEKVCSRVFLCASFCRKLLCVLLLFMWWGHKSVYTVIPWGLTCP